MTATASLYVPGRTYRMGLRFERSQASRLREIATQARSLELSSETVSLFDKAADSAEWGEPLLSVCQHPDEAQAMADGFVRFPGVDRPAVEGPFSGEQGR